jgi:hypothetical protein
MKYQLKSSRNTIVFVLASLAIVHGITFIFELIQSLGGSESVTSFTNFWMPFAGMSVFGILFIQFFRCSSGHVGELLYKDTNYLMLTIPRHGWEILGGRFLAGLIEYIIYGVGSFALLGVHALIQEAIPVNYSHKMFEFLRYAIEHLFLNFGSLLQAGFIALCLYAMTGAFISFAFTASRSFIKKRGAASIVAVIGFIVIINWTVKLGEFLGEKLGWFIDISFKFRNILPEMNGLQPMGDNMFVKMVQIPVASYILYALVTAAVFAAASWLMEKKVEV